MDEQATITEQQAVRNTQENNKQRLPVDDGNKMSTKKSEKKASYTIDFVDKLRDKALEIK